MDRLTAATAAHDRGARFTARAATDNARVFRSARRHSRRVRLLRIAIPSAIALIGGVIFAMTYLNPARLFSRIPTDFGSLVVSGTKITMQAPRLAGVTRDSRPYELTARAAAQDLTKPDVIELTDIRAKLGMQDGTTVDLSARDGVYNSKTEMLKLNNDIVVTSSAGYRALLSEAVVDVRKGHIVSEKPVVVRSVRGTINANRMEVLNSGDIVNFERDVEVTLYPEPGAVRPAKQAEK
jgi:lipopolysaccharide export system protein LptC